MSFGAGLNIGVRDTLSVAKYKTDRDNAERRNRLAELQFDYQKQRDGVRDAQFDQNLAHSQDVHIFNKKKFEEDLALKKNADARANRQEVRFQDEYDRGVAKENAVNAMSVVSVLDAKYDGDVNAIANSPEYNGAVSNLLGDPSFRAGVARLGGLAGDVEDVISTQEGFVARSADGKETLIPNEIMINATLMNGAANGALNNADLLRNMQEQSGDGSLAEGFRAIRQKLEGFAASNQPVEEPPVQQVVPPEASVTPAIREKYAHLKGLEDGRAKAAVDRLVSEYPELSEMSESDVEAIRLKKQLDHAEDVAADLENKGANRALAKQNEKVADLRKRYEAVKPSDAPAKKPTIVTAPMVKQAEQKADKLKLGKLQVDNLLANVKKDMERSRKQSLTAAASYMALAKQNGVAPDMDTTRRLLAGDKRTKDEIAIDEINARLQSDLYLKRAGVKSDAEKKRLTETYSGNKDQLTNAANALATRIYGPEPEAAQIKALEADMYEVLLSSEFRNVIDMNDPFGAAPTEFVAAVRSVADAIQKNRNTGSDLADNQVPTVTIPDNAKDIFTAAQGKKGILSYLNPDQAKDIFTSALAETNGDPVKALKLIEDRANAE